VRGSVFALLGALAGLLMSAILGSDGAPLWANFGFSMTIAITIMSVGWRNDR
jgi:urea transporter